MSDAGKKAYKQKLRIKRLLLRLFLGACTLLVLAGLIIGALKLITPATSTDTRAPKAPNVSG